MFVWKEPKMDDYYTTAIPGAGDVLSRITYGDPEDAYQYANFDNEPELQPTDDATLGQFLTMVVVVAIGFLAIAKLFW